MNAPSVRGAPELKRQVLVMLAAATAAVLARWWGGYPNCPTDELNWSRIAEQLDQGLDWPVSGPLHVTMLRISASGAGFGYQQTLALMGVLFVPIAMVALIWRYRRMGVSPLRMTLLALCLSSYFWAAMIESRPQQWGQVLVVIGATSLWMALSRRGSWWLYAGTLILTALTHILSYVLLTLISLWLLAYFLLLRESRLTELVKIVAAMMVSTMVFVVPGSPYGSMLGDIAHNHMRGNGLALAWMALLGLILVAGLALCRQSIRLRVLPWFEYRLRRARSRPWAFGLAAFAIVAATLSVQAAILPAAAWRPYGGSVIRFTVSQSGNLVFGALMLLGWVDTITRHDSSPALRAFAVMSLGWAVVGSSLLAASFFLLDTNWLLRVLNYAILFGAPLAAVPLAAILKRHRLTWIAVLAMSSISFLLAVRHLGIYSC